MTVQKILVKLQGPCKKKIDETSEKRDANFEYLQSTDSESLPETDSETEDCEAKFESWIKSRQNAELERKFTRTLYQPSKPFIFVYMNSNVVARAPKMQRVLDAQWKSPPKKLLKKYRDGRSPK